MNNKITMNKKFLFLIPTLAFSTAIFAQSGNVGIGTAAPEVKLHVMADQPNYGIDNTAQIIATGKTDVAKRLMLGYNTTTNKGYIQPVFGGIAWTDLLISPNGGNVGINQSTPGAKLDVNGTVKITDGTQGLDKVLTSDANGLASWKTPAAPVSTEPWNNQATNTGATANTQNIYQMGNVGIGIAAPVHKLDIVGQGVRLTNPGAASFFQASTGTSDIRLQNNNGPGFVGNLTAGQDFEIYAGGSPKIMAKANGNVGINQAAPGNKLEINSGTANASGLRFTNLKSTATTSAGEPIGVNANGDVVRIQKTGSEYATLQSIPTPIGGHVTYTLGNAPAVISNSNMSILLNATRTLLVTYNYGFDEVSGAGTFGNGVYIRGEIYMDGNATGYQVTYQVVRDGGGQISCSGIIANVPAGNHIFSMRMSVSSNAGVGTNSTVQVGLSLNAYAFGL